MTDDLRQTYGVLNRAAICQLVHGDPPLLTDYVDLQQQLQPNGFDVTAGSVASFPEAGSAGSIGISDADRTVLQSSELEFDTDGWALLAPGPYLMTFNEVVNLPRWLMALARPRSSLLRSGVAIHTAVWDAGYSGRSQALLNVYYQNGFWLQQHARVAQLVFIPLAQPDSQGYSGRYQRENI